MNTTNLNPPTQKNRLITMILAMFLGIFGIDRFYLGKWKSGIAMGLTSVVLVSGGSLMSNAVAQRGFRTCRHSIT